MFVLNKVNSPCHKACDYWCNGSFVADDLMLSVILKQASLNVDSEVLVRYDAVAIRGAEVPSCIIITVVAIHGAEVWAPAYHCCCYPWCWTLLPSDVVAIHDAEVLGSKFLLLLFILLKSAITIFTIHGTEVQWSVLLLLLSMVCEVGSMGSGAFSGATSVFQRVSLKMPHKSCSIINKLTMVKTKHILWSPVVSVLLCTCKLNTVWSFCHRDQNDYSWCLCKICLSAWFSR